MKKEAIQTFANRITQASKSELIVILYEMVLEEIAEAKEAYELKDLLTFDKELKRAHKYINELIVALDFKYQISYDLLSLYLFANKSIITAIMKRTPDSLEGVQGVITRLLTGFEGVSKADTSGPMMRNTQQLYAGLTYGKGTLNETYIDPNSRSRGFMV